MTRWLAYVLAIAAVGYYAPQAAGRLPQPAPAALSLTRGAQAPSHQPAQGMVMQCRWGKHAHREDRLRGFRGEWIRVDGYLYMGRIPDDLTTLDDCVAQAHAHGKVLVTLLNINRAADAGELMNPWQYAEEIGQLAARYQGRVDAWEVWNEPNHPLFWPGRPDPVAYARLLTLAYPAVKAADPHALVVAAGTSSVDLGYTERFLRERPPFDVMGAHPYEEPLGSAPGGTANGFAALPLLYLQMQLFGRHEPIWITEFGWPGGGHVAEALDYLRWMPFVQVALLYSWEEEAA
jgi:hypothetical protein